MSLRIEVLGRPGADNAVLVTVDSGQALSRLLFDCGEGCLSGQRTGVIQSVEHLCLSHFHMDHVSGFDGFFRRNYNRPETPIQVWGPYDTIDLMANRFRSFSWNLHADQPGEWIVHEIREDRVEAARFLTREAFAMRHPLPATGESLPALFATSGFRLEARLLPHHSISTAAYRIVENEHLNVSADALAASGLQPGAWLQALSDPALDEGHLVDTGNGPAPLGELRRRLILATPGDSAAYLTDFSLRPGSEEWAETVAWLAGTRHLVCECQYLDRDDALALRNGHMTAGLVGQLAAETGATSLTLMHLSARYTASEWGMILPETRQHFPEAAFPSHWDLAR